LRYDIEMESYLKNKGLKMVNESSGIELAKEMNAAGYIECSALTQEGLKSVFDTAIRLGIEKQIEQKNFKKRSHSCIIL